MKQPWLSRFITDFSFNSVPEAHFWKSEVERYLIIVFVITLNSNKID